MRDNNTYLLNYLLMFRRFCVVLATPPEQSRSIVPRAQRLREAVHRVEMDNETPKGDILPLVEFNGKSWTLWVHCLRQDKVSKTKNSAVYKNVDRYRDTFGNSYDITTRNPGRCRNLIWWWSPSCFRMWKSI